MFAMGQPVRRQSLTLLNSQWRQLVVMGNVLPGLAMADQYEGGFHAEG